MRCVYKAAWAVVGGINPPDDGGDLELYRSPKHRFVLTKKPEELMADADRATAVALVLLKGMFGLNEEADFAKALQTAIRDVQTERRHRAGSNPVLVLEAEDDLDATISGITRTLDDFTIAFDVIDKPAIAAKYNREVNAMKLAIALQGEHAAHFDTLGDRAWLIDNRGRAVYCMSLSGKADVTAASGTTNEGLAAISNRYGRLRSIRDLEPVQRLYSDMAGHRSDRLRAFLSGWAALEIFVGKTFKTYEEAFMRPVAEGPQSTLRKEFVKRIREVMNGRYNPRDKFRVVAAGLLPSAPEGELRADVAAFDNLKELRDKIYHGDPYAESTLPVEKLTYLLRKYLSAATDSGPAANS